MKIKMIALAAMALISLSSHASSTVKMITTDGSMTGGKLVKAAPFATKPMSNVSVVKPVNVVKHEQTVQMVKVSEEASIAAPGFPSNTVYVDASVSAKNDLRNWCSFREGEEVLIDHERGYFGFFMKKGTLLENVQRFWDAYQPSNQGIQNRVGRHMVVADTCMIERNPDVIIQKMIEPYSVGRNKVLWGDFTNGLGALFYRNDTEFAKYLTGVRK